MSSFELGVAGGVDVFRVAGIVKLNGFTDAYGGTFDGFVNFLHVISLS